MNFRIRSYRKELLDGSNIPFEDIKKNMQELDTINTRLGGHAITLKGFRSLLQDKKQIRVCEIGCGGGDNLVAIRKWCVANGIKVCCIGIDMKAECVELAKQQPELKDNCQWIVSDYADVIFDTKPDIIFSSLFCHHFTDEQLVTQLQWYHANSRTGFFINDLHRNWIAYYSISILTELFSSSYLVKNDAPLSVSRGFLKKEWEAIASLAGIEVTVSWEWAFRHLVIARHDN
jgi:2-polyprenyl-3-methyl-5-hydroxy-6-metoxy-1,4-benzoquinol methylase